MKLTVVCYEYNKLWDNEWVFVTVVSVHLGRIIPVYTVINTLSRFMMKLGMTVFLFSDFFSVPAGWSSTFGSAPDRLIHICETKVVFSTMSNHFCG